MALFHGSMEFFYLVYFLVALRHTPYNSLTTDLLHRAQGSRDYFSYLRRSLFDRIPFREGYR